jgi:hypothetical protein
MAHIRDIPLEPDSHGRPTVVREGEGGAKTHAPKVDAERGAENETTKSRRRARQDGRMAYSSPPPRVPSRPETVHPNRRFAGDPSRGPHRTFAPDRLEPNLEAQRP